MDRKELFVQVAVGSLTSPSDIAAVVKRTEDPIVLHWAAHHASATVRKAAASNSLLPDIDFLYLRVFDTAKTVQDALYYMFHKDKVRQVSLKRAIAALSDYPQFKLDFGDDDF